MKKFIMWTLAIIITCAAAVYQKYTGPTYPKILYVTLNDISYKLKFVRSIDLSKKSEVKLKIADSTVKATLFVKRLNSPDEYQVVNFDQRIVNEEIEFFADVPSQPASGKVQYFVELTDSKGTQTYFKESPVIVRFKGGVPDFVLIPHILCMFIAMLFSTLAGLMAGFKYPGYRKYGILTLIMFAIGGIILGPIVQNYAFGDYWTGVPFGWDLTDNKTLIALIIWVVAVIMNRKSDKTIYTILAAIILLIVFSIPHSLFGSTLDYATGKVTQGIILNFF